MRVKEGRAERDSDRRGGMKMTKRYKKGKAGKKY